MQIQLDINDNVAEALRALGLAIEDPVGVIDREAEIEEMRADLEKAAMEIDEAKAEIKRLHAQHDTDTRLIEGLREQLSKKDSPAPALAAALPPVRVEGLASEDVLKLQPRAERPQGAEHGAGPHSAVLRVPAPAGESAGGVAPVLRAGEGADGPEAAGARSTQPGADGGAAQAPGGEGRRGEGGAGDVAEKEPVASEAAAAKCDSYFQTLYGERRQAWVRCNVDGPHEQHSANGHHWYGMRPLPKDVVAGLNKEKETTDQAANGAGTPDSTSPSEGADVAGEKAADTESSTTSATTPSPEEGECEHDESSAASRPPDSSIAPPVGGDWRPGAGQTVPVPPASLRWGRIGPPETGAWHLWASAQDGEAACDEAIGPETEIVFVAEDESIPLEQMCQDCIGIESRQSAPAQATPSKNGKGICARCNGKETKRTVPTYMESTAPEYLRPFAGKHLCADCETELRKPRCKGKKADSSPCTARPKANGYCGRHHGQVPAAQEATG